MNQQGIGARQRWELGLAVASPVALLAVGVVLLFVPWSRASTCTAIAGGPQSCTSKSETLLEAGIPPEGWALVAMLLAVFLLVPVLAFGDVWLGLSWSRVSLRVVAVVLVLFAFVTGFTIDSGHLLVGCAAGFLVWYVLNGPYQSRPIGSLWAGIIASVGLWALAAEPIIRAAVIRSLYGNDFFIV